MAVSFNNFFGGAFFGGGFFGGGVQSSTGGGSHPSQGLTSHPPSVHARSQTKEQKRKSREEFGLVEKVIAAVAQSQSERLEKDEQKRFEELNRELELRGIEFEGRYLEALNVERERLINAEISLRIRQQLKNDEELMLLVLMAAA